MVGTLGIGEPPPAVSAAPSVQDGFRGTGLTTPDPVMLQQALRGLVDQGFKACALEASSIGLREQRLAGTHIDVALFTNLTLDHLDYHGSMAEYWQAKRELFAWPGLKAAVLNIDDAHGAALAEELRGTGIELWTCSTRGPARLNAQAQRYVDGGLAFELLEGERALPLRSALIGDFNAGNLLLVIGALRALGVPLDDALRAAGSLGPGARAHAACQGGGARATRSGGRLRPQPRCAGEGAACAAALRARTWRATVVRVRLRRQPRRWQAAS